MDLSADDLAMFLNVTFTEAETARAEFLLAQATTLAEGLIDPLPDTAAPVILSVAGRAWGNPAGASNETAGPFAVQRPGGLYLTRQDRASLNRLGGKGGAYTIDPTPVEGVDPSVTWPVPGVDDDTVWRYAEDEFGWDPW